MSEAERPKIIIDDDWKAQAQAEKAKLTEKEKARPAPAAPAAASGAASAAAPSPGAGPDENEPIGFADLVQVLASQALMYMGAVPDPQTGRAIVSPPMAQAHIELLAVVEEKTKGNLTAEETRVLQGVLYELRMQYVELGKAIEKAIKEGKIKPGEIPTGAPPAGGGAAPL